MTACRTCGEPRRLYSGGFCADCHPQRCEGMTPRGRCRMIGACVAHAGSPTPTGAAMRALRELRPMVGCRASRARAVVFRGHKAGATGCAHPVAARCAGHCYHGCIGAVDDALLQAGPLARGAELAVCEWVQGDPAPVKLSPRDGALLLAAGVAVVHVYEATGWRRTTPSELYSELSAREIGVADVA